MPEKHVGPNDSNWIYEGARTRVTSNVGITDMIPVGVGLHQGSSLSGEPVPFRHDYGCVGPQEKRIYPHGACYMLMPLYCVAPEVRLLKRN